MARDGFRIFDSDTHVGPYVDILVPYLAESEKARLADWDAYKTTHKQTGHVTYTRGQRRYRRRLGTATADETPGGYMEGFTGARRDRPVSPRVDDDPAERIGDMEYEVYASDYPHGESWFPNSVKTVLGGEMPDARKRKLFWDNAVRFYARCGLGCLR